MPAVTAAEDKGQHKSLFPRCANPRCSTSWMQVWRNRRFPVFEGKWACSPGCMEALVLAAGQRERSGGVARPTPVSHRVPIGLMLVGQGQITEAQLQSALAWRAANTGDSTRLGEWLVQSGLVGAAAVTRGLSLQWNCPAYSLGDYRPEETASLVPRLLVEMFGGVPVRIAGGVAVAFAGSVDRSLSYAVERATGLRVMAGIAADEEVQWARRRYIATAAPQAELLEASDEAALARAMAARIERERTPEARLVRVHEMYWLRLWRKEDPAPGLAGLRDVADILCTIHPRNGM
jgi:hypothetical protein